MKKQMKVYVGGYQGRSLVSKVIKKVTWGDFSHVALLRNDGKTIEAWHLNPAADNLLDRFRGKVTISPDPWTLHTPKTRINIFEILYPVEFHLAIWNSALRKVGQPYDFRALLGFLPGLRRFWKNHPAKWFCSHEIAEDCNIGGIMKLFNDTVPPYKIDPSYLVSSPWLKPIGEAKNMEDFAQTING